MKIDTSQREGNPLPGALSDRALRIRAILVAALLTVAPCASADPDPAAIGVAVGDIARQQYTPNEIVFVHQSGRLHYWTLFHGARFSGADLAGASSIPAGMQKTILGDVNGDGEDDIVYWAQAGQISYAPVVRGVVASNRINIGGLLPRSSGWDLLGAGDINGDGTDDLIFRHDNGYRVHYWRIRDGAREMGIDVGGAGYTPDSFVGAGDLNGDGTDDLVWVVNVPRPVPEGELPNPEYRVRYWPMRNGGRLGTNDLGEQPFEGRRQGNSILALSSFSAGVGDINGDGVDDILWRRADGQIHYWSIRDGALSRNQAVGRSGLLGPEWTIIGVGNVDGN